MVDIFSLQHSEETYKKAFEFIPERWEDETLNKFSWVPFSAGPRVCVGNNFSTLEQKFLVIRLLQKYKISFKNEKDITEINPSGFLLTAIKKDLIFEKI
jgi:cytochrome P450